MALVIKQFRLFVPKLTYKLRRSHFWKFKCFISSFDILILDILTKILNCPSNDRFFRQASLLVWFGGLSKKLSLLPSWPFCSRYTVHTASLAAVLISVYWSTDTGSYQKRLDVQMSRYGYLDTSARIGIETSCSAVFKKNSGTRGYRYIRKEILVHTGGFSLSLAVNVRLSARTVRLYHCTCCNAVDSTSTMVSLASQLLSIRSR